MINRINTLQLKGLRKILGLTTTFIDRANTNKKVFELANELYNPRHIPEKEIKTFGAYVNTKQQKLLAHTIRADEANPLRQATFIPFTAIPIEYPNRRVGRPRQNWSWHNLENIYIKNQWGTHEIFKFNRTECIQHIDEECRARREIY